jgi:excisionase family DNA binding protein
VDRLFTIRQAARQLQVSEKFLRTLQSKGRLRVVHLGRAVRIPEQEIERIAREGFRQ